MEGADTNSDLVMVFNSGRAFELMLLGESVPDADEPQCHGDPAMLERFGRILAEPIPASTGVQFRNFDDDLPPR